MLITNKINKIFTVLLSVTLASIASIGIFFNKRSMEFPFPDMRKIDDRWDYICLTSFESGEPYIIKGSYFRQALYFEDKSFPNGWDSSFIYAYLISSSGAYRIVKIGIEISHNVNTSYNIGSIPDIYDQCSSRRTAVATCEKIGPSNSQECNFIFKHKEDKNGRRS